MLGEHFRMAMTFCSELRFVLHLSALIYRAPICWRSLGIQCVSTSSVTIRTASLHTFNKSHPVQNISYPLIVAIDSLHLFRSNRFLLPSPAQTFGVIELRFFVVVRWKKSGQSYLGLKKYRNYNNKVSVKRYRFQAMRLRLRYWLTHKIY